MDLLTLAQIAEVLGFITVVAAVIFGALQIRHFRLQRRDLAAVELVRSFQDKEFTHALLLIHALPENISATDLRAKGQEYEEAALIIGMRYESMGVLVHRGVVPISAVDELVGGVAITLWSRLDRWVEAIRTEQSQPMFLEWFQWIVERFADPKRKRHEPAYKEYRNWKSSD